METKTEKCMRFKREVLGLVAAICILLIIRGEVSVKLVIMLVTNRLRCHLWQPRHLVHGYCPPVQSSDSLIWDKRLLPLLLRLQLQPFHLDWPFK